MGFVELSHVHLQYDIRSGIKQYEPGTKGLYDCCTQVPIYLVYQQAATTVAVAAKAVPAAATTAAAAALLLLLLLAAAAAAIVSIPRIAS